ncbi:MAG: hypothetical protein JWN26_464 [Candidatus Saccharibacteria bacterium]|nr:hypothetical protein [Candidatus Saccharibacteria bacterium]
MANQTSSHTQQAHNPGAALGIAGFILAFVGVQVVGLILSIIGYHKSKVAGFKNRLAVAGIVLNIVFMVIAIPIIAAITIVAYNGVTARANLDTARSNASDVLSYAEAFNADNGRYPDSLADFSAGTASTKLYSGITIINTNGGTTLDLTAATGKTNIWYQYDGPKGAATGGRITYWDYTNNKISDTVLYVGDGSSNSALFSDVN